MDDPLTVLDRAVRAVVPFMAQKRRLRPGRLVALLGDDGHPEFGAVGCGTVRTWPICSAGVGTG
jgi:hypothetical protein